MRTAVTWALVLALLAGAGAWYIGHRRRASAEQRERFQAFEADEQRGRTNYAQFRYWAKTNGICDAKNMETMRSLREGYIYKCQLCASTAECERVARAIDSKPEDAMMWNVCFYREDVSPRE